MDTIIVSCRPNGTETKLQTALNGSMLKKNLSNVWLYYRQFCVFEAGSWHYIDIRPPDMDGLTNVWTFTCLVFQGPYMWMECGLCVCSLCDNDRGYCGMWLFYARQSAEQQAVYCISTQMYFAPLFSILWYVCWTFNRCKAFFFGNLWVTSEEDRKSVPRESKCHWMMSM